MKFFIGNFFTLVIAVLSSCTVFADQSTSYTYNSLGKVLTEDGPRADVNDVTTYTYDLLGTRLTTTNALGHVVHYNTYDGAGRLLSVTDANGITTEFTYHDRGWLLSSRIKHPTNNALDSVTTYTYDAVGLMISMTLPNGYVVGYEYDDARRLKAIKNAAGERIEYTLDAAGNRLQQVIKNNTGTIVYSSAQAFDELSRVMAVTGNHGQNEKHQYDANDNKIAITNGRNNKTQQTYDALNRVAKIIDPNLKETQFTYDAQNRIKTVTDARGNITTYNYDGFGNLTSQTSPDTGTSTFTYDAAGNRTSAKDARGVVVNYSYDALNRLTAVSYPASATENVTYTYDSTANGSYGIGRVSSIANSVARTDYVYNYLGLITKKFIQIGATLSTVQYVYDTAGNLISMTYPSGRTVTYTRDAAGRVQSISTQAYASATVQTVVNNLTYLPFGPAASYTYGNGLSHSISYDTDYRPTAIQVGGVLSRGYSYDPVDNITAIIDSVTTTKNQTFGYDSLDRLTSATGIYGTLGYTYDAVGNRLSEKVGSTTYSYAYNSGSNRLLSVSVGTYVSRNFTGYDAAGNLTNEASGLAYSYNNAGRLSRTSSSGSFINSADYNALGQRISRTHISGTTGSVGSTTELFHYDEAGQLVAVSDSSGVSNREYIYNGSQLVGFVSSGTLYYVHNDHLGTPQVVTNQSKQVAWMPDYLPFGRTQYRQANSVELYSRFPGQYLDQETGLYYNYFRDYDPSIGRYIESDPIGLAGGINTYAYVEGNPIKSIDPKGLVKIHGNWCGPNWTGAKKEEYNPYQRDNYTKPIDNLDTACQIHDVCYYQCREDNPCNKGARAQCHLKCDSNLDSVASKTKGTQAWAISKAMERSDSREEPNNPIRCSEDCYKDQLPKSPPPISEQ